MNLPAPLPGIVLAAVGAAYVAGHIVGTKSATITHERQTSAALLANAKRIAEYETQIAAAQEKANHEIQALTKQAADADAMASSRLQQLQSLRSKLASTSGDAAKYAANAITAYTECRGEYRALGQESARQLADIAACEITSKGLNHD